MAPITKTQRWLDLVAYLVGRRLPVSVEEIMAHVPAYDEKWREGDETTRASVRRAFERDKDELRSAGIPIDTVRYRISYGHEQMEGYRLARRDFYLPYLKLISGSGAGRGATTGTDSFQISDSEASSALSALERVAELPGFPLAREARSAHRKLAFDLGLPRTPAGGVLYAEPRGDDLGARVRVLSDALLARKRVRFTYHGIYRGHATERDVEPYGLLFQRGTWYLIGHDHMREAVRVFRVGRMEEPLVRGKARRSPDYEIPADFSLATYRDREAWEIASEGDASIQARVLFPFPLSLWAERNGLGTLAEERDDGAVVRSFDVFQVDPFLRWMLSLEGEARILDPPELCEGLLAMARETRELYRSAAVEGADCPVVEDPAPSGMDSDG